jgi:hypothetical protein
MSFFPPYKPKSQYVNQKMMLLANNSIFNQPVQQLLKVSRLQLASCALCLVSYIITSGTPKA